MVKQVAAKPNDRIGSSFNDFLEEEGIFEEVQAGALQKVVAHRQRDEGVKADQGGDGQADKNQL